jgi:pimeloyl-ACP methyl ester carboxylesterase
MDYPAMAGDVLDLLDRNGFDHAALLGHSMGGKVAMWLALEQPRRVERLIVVDIAPVAYRHTLLHYVEAMRAVDLAAATRRADVDAALAASIPEPPIRAFLLQNLVQDGGRFAWRINLDTIGADMETITGFPEVAAGRRYDGPALFLAGERSDYVRPGHHDRIRDLFPNAVIETVADAGHWVHAEQPERVIERVSAFLAT